MRAKPRPRRGDPLLDPDVSGPVVHLDRGFDELTRKIYRRRPARRRRTGGKR